MKTKLTIQDYGYMDDFENRDDVTYVNVDYEVEEIKKSFGKYNKDLTDYTSFLIPNGCTDYLDGIYAVEEFKLGALDSKVDFIYVRIF